MIFSIMQQPHVISSVNITPPLNFQMNIAPISHFQISFNFVSNKEKIQKKVPQGSQQHT